jgi:hypothetical protein
LHGEGLELLFHGGDIRGLLVGSSDGVASLCDSRSDRSWLSPRKRHCGALIGSSGREHQHAVSGCWSSDTPTLALTDKALD